MKTDLCLYYFLMINNGWFSLLRHVHVHAYTRALPHNARFNTRFFQSGAKGFRLFAIKVSRDKRVAKAATAAFLRKEAGEEKNSRKRALEKEIEFLGLRL